MEREAERRHPAATTRNKAHRRAGVLIDDGSMSAIFASFVRGDRDGSNRYSAADWGIVGIERHREGGVRGAGSRRGAHRHSGGQSRVWIRRWVRNGARENRIR